MSVPFASERRSRELDGIRGVAVIAVLIHHAENLSGNPILVGRSDTWWGEISGLVRGGGLGIDMFFVLSAYLLGRAWVGTAGSTGVAGYAWRRARRVLPAYYVALLVPLLFMAGHQIPYEAVASRSGLQSLAAHLLLVHYLLPLGAGGFVIHGGLWTLTIEVVLYAVLPFVGRAFVGRRWMVSSLLAIGLGLCWRWGARHSLGWLIDVYGHTPGGDIDEFSMRATFLANQFPSFLADFAIGLSLASLVAQGRLRQFGQTATVVVAVAGCATVLVGFRLDGMASPAWLSYYGKHSVTALGTGLLIATGVAGVGRGATWLRNPALVWFGERGYGVFLWHLPVMWALLSFPMVHIDGSRRGFLELAAWSIPITIALAEWTYRLVEHPAMMLPVPTRRQLLVAPAWFIVPAVAGLLLAVGLAVV